MTSDAELATKGAFFNEKGNGFADPDKSNTSVR